MQPPGSYDLGMGFRKPGGTGRPVPGLAYWYVASLALALRCFRGHRPGQLGVVVSHSGMGGREAAGHVGCGGPPEDGRLSVSGTGHI